MGPSVFTISGSGMDSVIPQRIRCHPVSSFFEHLVLPFLGFGILYVIVLRSVYRAVVRPPRVREGWALGRGLPLDPDHFGVPWGEVEGLDSAWVMKGHGTTNWLLLHGHGRSRRVWMHILQDLLPHAASVVVVDFPGHGDATGEVGLGQTEHEALTAWLDSSGSRWWVAGMSMGAGVALRIAAQANRVDGAIGLGAGDLREALAGKLRQKALPAGIFAAPICWWLRRRGRLPGPLHELTPNRPILLVHGEQDQVAPMDSAQSLAAEKQWSFESLPDVGHDLLGPEHAGSVVRLMQDFAERYDSDHDDQNRT